MGKADVKTNMGRATMIQNFNDEQLNELSQQQEAEVLDDEYCYDKWREYHDSIREEEAVEDYYNKKHNDK